MATERQEAILEYIRSYQEKERVPPSSRLIQHHFNYGSQTTVIRHLKALAAADLVEQFADGRWGINRTAGLQTHFVEVPVYGSIPAGLPAFREQQPEETLPFDLRALRARGEVWAVRVQGDSMSGALIAEGDIAILERRDPRSGEIVAALVDETSTTLKRFLVIDGKAVLRAANEKYRDIFPESFACQGVLIAVFRRHGSLIA